MMLPGADQPDVSRGPVILGTVVAMTTLAFFVVVARVFVRLHMTKGFGIDVSL